jgi:hypothetical protein
MEFKISLRPEMAGHRSGSGIFVKFDVILRTDRIMKKRISKYILAAALALSLFSYIFLHQASQDVSLQSPDFKVEESQQLLPDVEMIKVVIEHAVRALKPQF